MKLLQHKFADDIELARLPARAQDRVEGPRGAAEGVVGGGRGAVDAEGELVDAGFL